MRFFSLVFIFITTTQAININDWQTVTNMNFVSDMVFEDSKLWVASTGGLYSYTPGDQNVTSFTNVNGLHAIEVAALVYDRLNQLVVGGKTGYLQTINTTTGESTLQYKFEDIQINDMTSQGDTLWILTNRGASQFLWDGVNYLFKGFFKNFRILPTEFNTIHIFNGFVWIGTDQGILSARANSIRLEDPAQWNVFNISSGLPSNRINTITSKADLLWVGSEKGIVSIDSDANVILQDWWGDKQVQSLAIAGSDLLVVHNFKLDSKRWGTELYRYRPGIGENLEKSFNYQANFIKTDNELNSWIGFEGEGILNTAWDRPFLLDSPGQNTIRYVIRDDEQNTWVSTGKFKLTPNSGFSIYNGSNWKSIDFTGLGWSDLGNSDVIYKDRFGNVWIGSWGGGVILYRNQEYKYLHNYDTDGGMLIRSTDSLYTQNLPANDPDLRSYFSAHVGASREYEIITSIKEDFSGRIWFGNYWPANGKFLAVATFNEDGSPKLNPSDWVYFGAETGIPTSEEEAGIACFEFDDFGRVWIGTFKNGLYILDYGGTISDKSDDFFIHLTTNDRLYSNEVRSLAKDDDGIIWIGTTGGLNSSDGVYVNNSINIFRHIGDIEGLAGPLGNRINHIAVDMFNNKWISTSAGLSILRADRSPWDSTGWVGYESSNSGLVDDQVHGVFIDHLSLEALIATEKGLSVFKGTFAEIKEDYSEVVVGPNPFIIGGGSANVVIGKLKQNSTVRILNMNGVLVRELSSENGLVTGSRASWDGKDTNGEKVASGIYLFMAFNEDGTSTAGKIAVIRR